MNKVKKIFASVFIILVFFSVLIPKSNANFFTDDWDHPEKKSEITRSIEDDDGGIFEKIIAKMIGGLAETVFDLTTNEKLGMGFKNYDELIFSKDSTDISPFTDEQWNLTMKWYTVMSSVAGSLILIVVVIVAYKFIAGGFSVEKRAEAKDSILRLFFGAVAIASAPLFVKFLLFLNNNLVHLILNYSGNSLDDLLGNSVISNVKTGNAIATSLVIAMFAYLFFKLNVKFIIRQFTIIIFTLFTPIVAIMWMINKRAIGASLWFGQILINVFMQFIYAFLFLMYINFLPKAGGWATSLLWAMMILPIADVLQNTLQNLISRVAGINNDELANRGIGMAGAMAGSLSAIGYQFKNSNMENIGGKSIIGKIFNNGLTEKVNPMEKTKMQTTPMDKTKMKSTNLLNNDNKENGIKNSAKSSIGKKVFNTGKEIMNMGMYAAEGKNFKNNRQFNRPNINNTRKDDISKFNDDNIITKLQENEFNDK